MGKHKAIKPLRRKLWFRVLKWGTVALAFGVIATLIAGYLTINHFDDNIKTKEIHYPSNKNKPVKLPEVKGSMNVLLIGSDSRKGTKIKGETPGLSDTTILLHIAADRSFVYGVSIPRDLMTNRPECYLKDSEQKYHGGFFQFNSAYTIGGPACTVATVENMTNIHIDHFVALDLSGFQDAINSIGGVQICVPHEVNDPIGHIKLKEGTYTVKGKKALDYVRVRHNIGDGLGDIGRMKRQQVFLSSMVSKIMDKGTLTNPKKTLSLINTVTSNLTTDPDFASVTEMAGIAYSLRGINSDNVKFITAPVIEYPQDRNRVILTSDAENVWHSIKTDTRLPENLTNEAVKPESTKNDDHSTIDSDGTLSERKNLKKKSIVSKEKRDSYGIC